MVSDKILSKKRLSLLQEMDKVDLGKDDMSDSEVLRNIVQSDEGGFFARLWNGEWKGEGYLTEGFANFLLCCHLAREIGHDARRIKRLFEVSGHYSRMGLGCSDTKKDAYLDELIELVFEEMGSLLPD